LTTSAESFPKFSHIEQVNHGFQILRDQREIIQESRELFCSLDNGIDMSGILPRMGMPPSHRSLASQEKPGNPCCIERFCQEGVYVRKRYLDTAKTGLEVS
jgi:hypothetical protein